MILTWHSWFSWFVMTKEFDIASCSSVLGQVCISDRSEIAALSIFHLAELVHSRVEATEQLVDLDDLFLRFLVVCNRTLLELLNLIEMRHSVGQNNLTRLTSKAVALFATIIVNFVFLADRQFRLRLQAAVLGIFSDLASHDGFNALILWIFLFNDL